MESASKNALNILRYYIDECRITNINQHENAQQNKSIIYKVVQEIKCTEQAVIDKETEAFFALRLPDAGIIFEAGAKNGNHITVIFKGKYYTQNTEKEQIALKRKIITLISQMTNSFPVLTKIDIANDIEMKIKDFDPKKLQFGFRARVSTFTDTKDESINTYYIHNTNFQICIYNKTEENKKQKNKQKKEYYDNLYKDKEEVVRIETRLKSKIAREYTQAILETESLQKIAMIIMSDFTKQRRIYKRNASGKLVSRKNQYRLEEWQPWKTIRTCKIDKKISRNKNLKIKQQYSSLKNVKKSIIETAFKNKGISKEDLLDFIENNYDEIKEKTKKRLIEKEEHEKEVKRLKEQIFNH